MEKKLPKVFANTINKELKNNDKVYYSQNDEKQISNTNQKQNNTRKKTNKNINQKINEIFNSPTYVYKANVDIKLKSGTVNKQIIGKNATNLITIDNELIPISEIEDIYFSKEK